MDWKGGNDGFPPPQFPCFNKEIKIMGGKIGREKNKNNGRENRKRKERKLYIDVPELERNQKEKKKTNP